VSGDGICTGNGTNEDRLDCADEVYDLYYVSFQNTYGRIPMLVDVMASVFDEELSLAVMAQQTEFAVEAYANNYLANCSNGCTKAQLMWWLASKQGWYDYASDYKPISGLVDSENRSGYSPTAANRVFTESWIGGYGDGNVPYDWANWHYGADGYWSIINKTSPVLDARL